VPIASAIDTFGSLAVPASLKVESLAALVTLARARPGTLNCASGGGAFPTLLAGFTRAAGLDMVQVPYREQNLAIQDLAEGRIQCLATSLTALLPLAKTRKIRLLAVTNKRRAPAVPEVPTAVEAGYPELEFEGLVGFFGGRDMPSALRDRISGDVRAAAADPVLAERLVAAGDRGRTRPLGKDQRARIESIVKLNRGRR
jgi:tripartite-type tricarboxylate transporter receptor subunit TctC